MRSFKVILFLLFSSILMFSCNQKKDPVTGKVIRQETNVDKKAENSPGIFLKNFNNAKKSNNFEFSTSNVLWRASIESLNFVPLANASYSGGIIITDWYSPSFASNEQVKINVRFLSNELSPTSIDVKVFKKTCKENNSTNCAITKDNTVLSNKIKTKIMEIARNISIKEELNKDWEK